MARRRKAFDPRKLPKHYDAAKCEEKWIAYWQDKGIYRYDADAPDREIFSIDAPPPTVSGSLHIGHVFSYTHKDIVARYMRMKGKRVFYTLGWDDNGLPTERRVQDYYHVRCSPEKAYIPDYAPLQAAAKVRKGRPETISRKNFIELCGRLTAMDEIVFKKIWMQCGLSCDWRLEYATMDSNSIRQAQLSFLDLYGKGHIVQHFAPTIWDVDFETSVAQAELEDRETQAVFYRIRFRLADGGGAFTIATTRPELLPACIGITAHPDDARYQHLFGRQAISPLFSVSVPIFASEQVDPGKGTGIVMVCTFGDAADIEWWRREKLPLRQILNSQGRLKDIAFGAKGWESGNPGTANRYYSSLADKTVFSAREAILGSLREPDASDPESAIPLAETSSPELHTAKYYEKGKKPVEYLATRQWFVRILDKKDQLLEAGNQIEWHPPHMLSRYTAWSENLAYDWCISRQRYFGVPFPVWYEIDTEGKADYAKPLLPERSDLPIDPAVDTPSGYREDMRNRPNGFTAEPDVFDTWFTSSLTPYIARGIDCDSKEKPTPMDLRSQSHEIIRTWAFYTIVKSLLHHNSIPWRNVMISGWVLDPDRKKMSKSMGNVVTPGKLLEDYTADGVRYWAANARLGRDTAVDEKVMKTGRKLVTKLYNASRFVLSYPSETGAGISEEIDVSFMMELKRTVQEATDDYQHYHFSEGLKKTEDFFYKRFTDIYLELAKVRLKGASGTEGAGISAAVTLQRTLSILLKLFAPVMPFITEEIWSWSYAEQEDAESIHTSSWPTDSDFKGLPETHHDGSFNDAAVLMHRIFKVRAEKKLPNTEILDSFGIENNELKKAEGFLEDIKAACRVRDIHSLS